jgi:hypothetical protein
VTGDGHDRNQTSRMFRIRNSFGTAANGGGCSDKDYDYFLHADRAGNLWVVYQAVGFL